MTSKDFSQRFVQSEKYNCPEQVNNPQATSNLQEIYHQ